MDQIEGVEPEPYDHDPDLDEDEDPTPDQAGEVVGDAVGEREAAPDLAVEVTHRGMVVLMLDQVAGDSSISRAMAIWGVFLWGCCVGFQAVAALFRRNAPWLG